MTARPSPYRLVVAPDKFKGSLTAVEVAERVAAGFEAGFARALPPGAPVALAVERIPVADGGEGTVAAALAAGWRPLTATVPGPTGEPVRAVCARSGAAAIVELAEASGLDRLPGGVRAPLTASTRGTGELLRAALDDGAREVVLAVGGSASTDGGAGLLAACGARLLDGRGAELPDGGGALADLDRVDLSGLDPRLAGVRTVLAADVDNPLLGPRGAAAVFGPQKGASPADVAVLEAGLARFADALAAAGAPDARALPGAGAAGGTGLVALGVLRGRRRPGIDVVLELTRFAERAAGADLVVTGEGSLDEQSLGGKTPVGVALAAARLGIPVVAVSGRRLLQERQWRGAGFSGAHALTDLEPEPARCIAGAGPLLERLAAGLGERAAREAVAAD